MHLCTRPGLVVSARLAEQHQQSGGADQIEADILQSLLEDRAELDGLSYRGLLQRGRVSSAGNRM